MTMSRAADDRDDGPDREVSRRRACGLIVSGLLVSRSAHAKPPQVADVTPAASLDMSGPPAVSASNATLLVGGPPGGTAREFAALLAPLLGPALLGPKRTGPDARVALDPTGGLDGVTAANEFEARASQDGTTALMVPGAAALAWLAGDPRVHFDAGLWIPALAAVAPAVLIGRKPLDRLRTGDVVRLAVSSIAGSELPALLGLELLRLRAEPIGALRLDADKEAALRDGTVDAMLLSGRDVPSRLAGLQAAGFAPLFALGRSDGEGGRDPAIAHAETLDELVERLFGHPPRGFLAPAFRASAAAAQLDAALVLPQLAPPGIVARWRAACDQASASLTLQAVSSEHAVRPLAAPGCVGAVSAVLAGQTALFDLHRFLADRYGWRPV